MRSNRNLRALHQPAEKQGFWKREKVAISSPKVVKVTPDIFKKIARGRIADLPSDLDLLAGTKIYIKEHDGYIFTGREIVVEITKVSKAGSQFKKYSVIYDEDLGNKSKRNLERVKKADNNSATI